MADLVHISLAWCESLNLSFYRSASDRKPLNMPSEAAFAPKGALPVLVTKSARIAKLIGFPSMFDWLRIRDDDEGLFYCSVSETEKAPKTEIERVTRLLAPYVFLDALETWRRLSAGDDRLDLDALGRRWEASELILDADLARMSSGIEIDPRPAQESDERPGI